MLVKICGITTPEDAQKAVLAGADLIGLNFYPGSPRCITAEQATRIRERVPAGVEVVGIFVNEPEPEQVARVALRVGLGAVQLHGEESPEYCAALGGLRVIKAFRLGPGFEPAEVTRYDVNVVLLDAFRPGEFGGTGESADWELAAQVCNVGMTTLLSGGLTPENVRDAILRVRPQGVDVASGVEFAPGCKDPKRVRDFVRAARKAAAELGAAG